MGACRPATAPAPATPAREFLSPPTVARITAALVDEWGDKTAKTAHDILKQPDVKVTNQKDKDMQLPKLKKLNEFAKSAVADVATAALPPAPPHARTCQCL